jgi:hypothetical protein
MTMKRLGLTLVLVCLPLACATDNKPPAAGNETPNTDAPNTDAPKQPAAGEPPAFEGTRVRVSDGPLPFTLELADSGMSGSRVGDGDYLTLSGPPGGPLMLRIYPATVGADLHELVAALRPDAELLDGRVTLLGAERPAVAWVSGESMARTAWCGIIVAPVSAAAGQPALLLELGVGHQGDAVDCKIVSEHHVLGPVIASLTFE